jgi:hypothetical protein
MFGTIFTWIKEYGTLLLELIKRYGLKTVLTIFLIGGFLFAIGYVIDVKINQIVPQTVEQSIDESYEKKELNHQEMLIHSNDMYSEVKQKLRTTLKDLGCQYIYLIEYHNGSENIATSIPFRKFDVTIDICESGVPYINTSIFKDEHITKYDIFDNPDFTKQQFMMCSINDFKNVDYKLYQNTEHNKKIKWVYTYNLYYKCQLLGAILILSYDKIDLKLFVNHMHELETIFNRDVM